MARSQTGTIQAASTDFEVEYDNNGFPKDLLHWRKEPQSAWSTARHIWDPLEDIFEHHGYTLFIATEAHSCCLVPKVISERRVMDRYHHVLPEDQHLYESRFVHHSNKLCPATRKADGTHVMIQLVCKAGQGHKELDILRYFSQPALLANPANHVIPLLDELHYLDMSFAVMPLLHSEPFNVPWFLNLSEALDAMHQTFEGLSFIHEHLVAHRDLGSGEIVLNFGGPRLAPQYRQARRKGGPFRCFFSPRYYIIDFETAIRFSQDSSPNERVVTGMATLLNHGTDNPKHYGKALPPEWTSEEPYSPFASDVFQLAGMWRTLIALEGNHLKALASLMDRMTSISPADRPTSAEALSLFEQFRRSLTADELGAPVAEYCEPLEGNATT